MKISRAFIKYVIFLVIFTLASAWVPLYSQVSLDINKYFRPAEKEDIVGIWTRKVGSSELPERTPYQVFMFSRTGIAKEIKTSKPYKEMEKAMPGFVYAAKRFVTYTIDKGDAMLTYPDTGDRIPLGILICVEDIPEDIAEEYFKDSGGPEKGDLMMILPVTKDLLFLEKVSDIKEPKSDQ